LRGEPIEPWVISELKRAHGAKAILWWVKTTRWSARMERDSLVFDAMFTIHQRLAGDHVLHMPAFALDRERYFRPEVREEGWPALFVGCWSERRQLYLESIANLPLAIIGPNWRKRLKPNHPLYPRIVTDWVAENELADCYRRATVVVDIGQIDRHADEGETMRVADVPACGAVLITEPSRAVEHYFRPGSVVCISTPAELQMQLESILADRDRLRRTAEQAWEDVQALPSFDEKVEVFLRAVRLLPSLAEE
ncbi:MAG: glycosyltransferase, partial [Nitrosomonas ureae]